MSLLRSLPGHRAAALVGAAIFLSSSSAAAGDFMITALDIGQGDSTVVIAPGGCAAILDGGPKGSGAVIKSYLRGLGVNRLDFAITSHFHADHIGGLDEVEQGADAIPVGVVYDNGSPGGINTVTYTEYASQYSGRRVVPVLGQVVRLCSEVTFEFVAVDGNGLATSDENTRSIAVRISYGELDAIVGGDLMESPTNLEADIAPRVGPVEIYKVHHHGSKYSSGDGFLDVTQPVVATISVGKNSYGHPTPEALARLAAHAVDVFQTEDPGTSTKLGHIQIKSALGTTFIVTQGPVVHSYVSKGVDITPPSSPGGLVATAVSENEVDLSWQASSDNVAVVAYDITRSTAGGAFGPIGSTSLTAATDLGLAANTRYTYAVVARDAAANVSASALVEVQTPAPPDTTPPSTPTGMVATPGSGQVALSWQASQDNVGVTQYVVQRDGVERARVSQPGLVDSGLPASTSYSYAVLAVDAAGNRSPLSSLVTARTYCSAQIVSASWDTKRKRVTVRATNSEQPQSTMVLRGDNGVLLGSMTWNSRVAAYELTASGTPQTVTAVASCGGSASRTR